MTNLLLHNYYYRYREKRLLIKNQLVDTGNYEEARTQLQATISEHELKFPAAETRKDFNYGEQIMMEHALRHLNAVIDRDDPEYFDTQIGQIKHQSDIVKEALERVPKSDYNDIVEEEEE